MYAINYTCELDLNMILLCRSALRCHLMMTKKFIPQKSLETDLPSIMKGPFMHIFACILVISYGTFIFTYYSIHHTSIKKLLIASRHPKFCEHASSLWYFI